MMTETIDTVFAPRVLPEWAQSDQAIKAYCKANLSFRVDVCQAETVQMRQALRRQAWHWYNGEGLI